MLGNPKTHLRNVLGNTTHYMVTEIKDNIAATMEGVADSTGKLFGGQGIDRTKSVLNRLNPSDNKLIKIARNDANAEAYKMLNDGNKYRDARDAVRDNMRAFNGNKVLNALEGGNSWALDAEDYLGLKNKYSKSLARYLKANGADASIFTKNDDASRKLLAQAREHAVKEAKEATFHADNAMAEKLTQWSSDLRNSDNSVGRLGGMAFEGLLPFKKTPINILKQGVKYSPVSLAKAMGDFANAVTKGNKSASDVIEDLAAGMTGTGIMALGAYLANKGWVSGGANPDYDIDTTESEQGKQNYALQLGGKSYTIDWLAPASLPLFVGVELFNSLSENTDMDTPTIFEKILASTSAIAEPITEMSMLQGINDALQQLSYSKENALGTLLTNTAIGYATQGVPTLAGQVARAVDPIRRDTYSEKPSGMLKQLDRAVTKVENKIPGLSQLNPEYRNQKGETQQNVPGLENSLAGRLAYQMLSPGYYANDNNVTATDQELNRLYEATGEKVYGTVTDGNIGDGYDKLTKEQKAQFQELYGQTNTQFAEAIINSEGYASLDDDTKAEVIKNARALANNIAKYEIAGKDIPKTYYKAYDAYEEGGIQGVADFYINKEQKKTADAEAKEAGFTSSDAQQKVESVLGSDTNTLNNYNELYNKSVNDKGNVTDELFIGTLSSENLTDEQRGEYLIAKKGGVDSLSKKAQEAYEKEGAKGVWDVYNAKPKETKTDKGTTTNSGVSDSVAQYYGSTNNLNGMATFQKLDKEYQSYTWSADGKPTGLSNAKQDRLIPFLRDKNVSPKDAGDVIIATKGGIDKLAKGAQAAYNYAGNEGVYMFYDIKQGADIDKSNGLVKDEILAYVMVNYPQYDPEMLYKAYFR